MLGGGPGFCAAPPPVEAFGRLPAIADAAIAPDSPDGTKVALALSIEGTAVVRVLGLPDGRTIFAGRMDEGTTLVDVGFADDTHVTYLMRQTFHPGMILPYYVSFRGNPRRVDYYRNGVVDLTNSRTNYFTTDAANEWADQYATLVAPIEGEPGAARMIGRVRGIDVRGQALYRVNLNVREARPILVRGQSADTIGYLLDERGRVVARVDSDEETNHWRVFYYDDERTPRLLLEGDSPTGVPIRLEGLLQDNRIAAIDDNEAGLGVLYAIDPRTGQREVLLARAGEEVVSALNDPWTRRVVGAVSSGQEHTYVFFDADLREAAAAIKERYDGSRLLTWSRDRQRILFDGEQGLDGGGIYLFRAADKSVARVMMRYPEVAAAQSGARQSITYRARDNTVIPAYLTLPDDNARNRPLVIIVHGGPHGARDTMDFDWWAAFLASRGYVVLQPNFRGSGGYGTAWEEAGRRQWGGLMQTDVEDGIAPLARAGFVDPARVCIIGASYGGYAALAGATLTPERYKCAASIAGVSDLPAMLGAESAQHGRESMSADFWRLSIGDRQEDRDRIRSVSPAYLADRVRAPILLVHGTDDTIVPITQSRTMRDRLRGAGKDVRYVELEGDDHYLSDAPTRVQMLRELETFLAANLGSH